MNIRQLQTSYIPEQDRLLTRINTAEGAELRLWLTRRLVRLLWPALVKIEEEASLRSLQQTRPATVTGEARRMVAEMAREAATAKADFSTPFTAMPMQLPLGAEPLLVSRIDLTPQPDGHTRIAFHQQPGRCVEIAMDEQLLHGFIKLMRTAMQGADWDLVLGTGPVADAGARVLN